VTCNYHSVVITSGKFEVLHEICLKLLRAFVTEILPFIIWPGHVSPRAFVSKEKE